MLGQFYAIIKGDRGMFDNHAFLIAGGTEPSGRKFTVVLLGKPGIVSRGDLVENCRLRGLCCLLVKPGADMT